MSNYTTESSIIGYDAMRFPCPSSPKRGMILLSILKKSIEGYRVYSAIVDDVSAMDPDYTQYRDWVAANGNKRSFRDAVRIFPGLTEKEYVR